MTSTIRNSKEGNDPTTTTVLPTDTNTNTTTTTTYYNKARLVPLHRSSEKLSFGMQRRPELYFLSERERINLGQNSVTKIADRRLDRRECVLQLQQGRLTVTYVRHQVWINHDTVLSAAAVQLPYALAEGDVVRLGKTAAQPYAYRVRYPRQPSSNTVQHPTTSSSSTPAAATVTATHRLPKTVASELYCPICLELQYQPQLLIPCGHSVCGTCHAKLLLGHDDKAVVTNNNNDAGPKCPTCRAPLQGCLSNPPLHQLVERLVVYQETSQSNKNNLLLPPDDVTAYRAATKPPKQHKAPAFAASRKKRRTQR